MKRDVVFLPMITGLIVCILINAKVYIIDPPVNSRPEVTIIAPQKNKPLKWNSTVNYSIVVNDREDGKTEFNEIQSREVLLKIAFIPDSLAKAKYIRGTSNAETEPAGLSLIRKSDCFNCHGWKDKLMGPSFEMIAARYPNNHASVKLLARKIISGSKGVWGTNQMPAHAEMKESEAKQLVHWLLTENTSPGIIYQTGTEGVFRTRAQPTKNGGRAVYILTASYRDQGLKNSGDSKKIGASTILLTCEE